MNATRSPERLPAHNRNVTASDHSSAARRAPRTVTWDNVAIVSQRLHAHILRRDAKAAA